jgi:hypothetical protein
MEEIVIYRAFDGKDFEDEDECREYEFAENAKGCEYSLLNSSFRLLDRTIPNSYDYCSYIFVPDEQAMEDLSDNWDEDLIGSCCPDFIGYGALCGLYAYDHESEEWYHVGERIAALQDMADQAMEVINNN